MLDIVQSIQLELHLCCVAQCYTTLCNPMNCGSSVHGNSPGKNTGVGCPALLQGIFPTQGSIPNIPHCRLTTQLPHKIWIYDFKISFPFSKLSLWVCCCFFFCLFCFVLMISFAVQKLSGLIQSHLILLLFPLPEETYPKRYC